LRLEGSGKQAKVLFSQPPKARFERVAYDAQPRRVVFELRRGNGESSLYPWSLRHTARLVEIVRDIARERLLSALPDGASIIERYLIGRKPDGRDAAPAADRIRIIPLPSRGHEQVDPAVRRVLVEVPGNCSLRFDDVLWALSGQPHFDSSTGEVIFLLVESVEKKALEQYLLPEGARLWRSVTGVVLPIMRRRIDPVHQREEAKSARERSQEEASAISSVHAAIRHARIDAQATHIRVQREPHDRRGENAEQFVEGTRFSRHQMWHVELTFNRPVRGALVLGDGRFLGLGLMAPVQEVQGVWAFRNASGPIPNADAEEIARALRRAVMARAQAVLGSRESLPQLISGHEPDGNPIRDRGHLVFQFEPYSQTLLVIAPHVLERRSVFQSERRVLMRLDEALDNFTELRAGTSGLLALSRVSFEGACPLLFEPARIWTSVTPYLVNRHAKAKEASQALIADIREECTRRGLPSPRSVEVLDARGISGKGLTGHVRIEFAVAISGPIFLGRSRYSGGGSFSGMSLVHSAQSDAVGNSRFF
jgi:CRISPR-associated protein Csb2